jgi:ribonuclease E
MSKEIYISTTPHETRLAIVENEALTEIYYERENEYTLAGSIYNGRVTRVLPGMQSAFVDVGLERDAFLYITDFMEEAPDAAEFDTGNGSEHRAPRLTAGEAPAQDRGERTTDRGERTDRGDRGGRGRRGGRDRSRGERHPERTEQAPPPADAHLDSADSGQNLGAESYSESGSDLGEPQAGEAGTAEGSRRWRGRRGRRRGRGNGPGGQEVPQAGQPAGATSFSDPETTSNDETLFEGGAPLNETEAYPETQGYDLGASSEPTTSAPVEGAERREGRRDRGRFDRSRRRGGTPSAEQEAPQQRTEQRPEPRGGSEQRGGDRGQRAPRGFSPSRNLYGVEESETYGRAEPAGEPIILPGESRACVISICYLADPRSHRQPGATRQPRRGRRRMGRQRRSAGRDDCAPSALRGPLQPAGLSPRHPV